MDYNKSRIYKIVNDVNDEIYVGSTIQPLSKRMGVHRANAKKYPERKLYKLFNSLGVEHFKIILIQQFPCKNREELEAKEEEYRILLKSTLNMNRCHVTEEEIKNEHSEYIKKFQPEYNKIKTKCEYCKSEIVKHNKSIHEKTLKHHRALEAIATQ